MFIPPHPPTKLSKRFRKIAFTRPSTARTPSFEASCFLARRGCLQFDEHAPGIEIGRVKDTYRRVRIESTFGRMTVLATGYEVDDLTDTLRKALEYRSWLLPIRSTSVRPPWCNSPEATSPRSIRRSRGKQCGPRLRSRNDYASKGSSSRKATFKNTRRNCAREDLL